MYKIIPGNPNYKISLQGDVVTTDGTECTLPIKDNKIFITIYKKEQWYDLDWISLIAYYEIFLPDKFRNNVFKITFPECNPKMKNCSRVPLLPKMMIDGKYRIIPGFSNYAIDRSGTIIEVFTGNIIPINSNRGIQGYPSGWIYDPDSNRKREITVHRLLALAWLQNNDYVEKFIINHKDGDKYNHSLSNLEWCSYSENALHAFQNGLRNDNQECSIRDIHTGNILEFHSISEAFKFMGYKSLKFEKPIRETKLLKNRYEFRIKADDTPWFYIGKDKPLVPGRYVITVVDENDNKSIFYDVRSLIKGLRIWNIPSQGINCVIENACKKYPGLKITYRDLYETKPVQALEIATGKVIEKATCLELSNFLNINKSSVRNRIREYQDVELNGYLFRYKSENPWPKPKSPNSRLMCILATNVKTDEILEFSSLRETAKYFNVDRSVITLRIKNNKLYNDWYFVLTN